MDHIADNDEILTSCNNDIRFCGWVENFSLDLSKVEKAK